MSSDSVTDALVAWLDAPNVIGLSRVYDEAPWYVEPTSWDLAAQLGWGAVGFIHINHEQEHRVAMGGSQGGIKQIDYDVGVVLCFQYLIGSTIDPDSGSTGYRRPLNQLLDGVRARLRQDRTIGTAPGVDGLGGIEIEPGGSILQVGEGDGTSGVDITVTRDLPRRAPGKIWSWQLVEFKVVEFAVT